MLIYLIRHGLSVANERGLVTGTVTDELSIKGVAQVERFSMWLEKTGIRADYHISSHWKRAGQTAKLLQPEAAWSIDERLGETYAGNVSDWCLSDFLRKFPDFYDDNRRAYPGGESHIDLNVRVMTWFDETINAFPENTEIMLVAHSGPISCILQNVVGVGMDKFPVFTPLNASLSIVEVLQNPRQEMKLRGFSMGPESAIHDYFEGLMDWQ